MSTNDTNLKYYILQRSLSVIWTSIAAVTIVFFLFRFLPTDPFAVQAVSSSLGGEAATQLRTEFGLDEPLYIQYYMYMLNVFTLDFGISFRYRAPVTSVIIPKMFNSLILLGPAVVLSFILGPILGTVFGWFRNNLIKEKLGVIFYLFMRASPVYIPALIFISIFAYGLGWVPAGRMVPPTVSINGPIDYLTTPSFYRHLALPLLTTVVYYSSDPALIMRSGVMETRLEEFMELHRAKGLSTYQLMGHAARNSLLPLFTYLGVRLGMIFQGQVLIEVVFSWPGIGRELINAIIQADYPVVQGVVIIMAFTVILLNFLVDLGYAYFDPTVDHG
jgi:peptide/nickel transport system permease protein